MIAVISDVHGNFPALKAVLEEIDKLGCEKIISLGDVAGYYCAVNECIDEFRRRSIINMMGNHDSYLLGLGKCPRSLTVNQCIDYQRQIITVKNIEYLKKSPLAYLNNTISARHGGWSDPIDEYIENFDFSIRSLAVNNLKCKFFAMRFVSKPVPEPSSSIFSKSVEILDNSISNLDAIKS